MAAKLGPAAIPGKCGDAVKRDPAGRATAPFPFMTVGPSATAFAAVLAWLEA